MDADTTGIVIGSGAVGALCTLAATWIKAKVARRAKIEPDPLNVRRVADCVSVKECNRRMGELEARLCRVESRVADGFERIIGKLDSLDDKSEKRSCDLHARVDLISERTASLMGEVGMIKNMVKGRKQ